MFHDLSVVKTLWNSMWDSNQTKNRLTPSSCSAVVAATQAGPCPCACPSHPTPGPLEAEMKCASHFRFLAERMASHKLSAELAANSAVR